ncbi:MAG: GxxExxY protein [Pirellulales bacterium]
MEKDPIFDLCDVIRETAFAAHRFLGPGHLEKVYETSLFNRLKKQGIHVERQTPLFVYDEDGSIWENISRIYSWPAS